MPITDSGVLIPWVLHRRLRPDTQLVEDGLDRLVGNPVMYLGFGDAVDVRTCLGEADDLFDGRRSLRHPDLMHGVTAGLEAPVFAVGGCLVCGQSGTRSPRSRRISVRGSMSSGRRGSRSSSWTWSICVRHSCSWCSSQAAISLLTLTVGSGTVTRPSGNSATSEL